MTEGKFRAGIGYRELWLWDYNVSAFSLLARFLFYFYNEINFRVLLYLSYLCVNFALYL